MRSATESTRPTPVFSRYSAPPAPSIGTTCPSATAGTLTPFLASVTGAGRLIRCVPSGRTISAVADVLSTITGVPAAIVRARRSPAFPAATGSPWRPCWNGTTCPVCGTGTHRAPLASMPACPSGAVSVAGAPTGVSRSGSICWTVPLTRSIV